MYYLLVFYGPSHYSQPWIPTSSVEYTFIIIKPMTTEENTGDKFAYTLIELQTTIEVAATFF